jgi:hypothetical protein
MHYEAQMSIARLPAIKCILHSIYHFYCVVKNLAVTIIEQAQNNALLGDSLTLSHHSHHILGMGFITLP